MDTYIQWLYLNSFDYIRNKFRDCRSVGRMGGWMGGRADRRAGGRADGRASGGGRPDGRTIEGGAGGLVWLTAGRTDPRAADDLLGGRADGRSDCFDHYKKQNLLHASEQRHLSTTVVKYVSKTFQTYTSMDT